MSGNVWELCHDVSDDYPSPPVTDPTGGSVDGRFMIIRGGGSISPEDQCLTAPESRDSVRRTTLFHDIGFRVARTP